MTQMVRVESPKVTSGTLSKLIICFMNSGMFSTDVPVLIYSYIIRSFFNNKSTIKSKMYLLKRPYDRCDQHRCYPEQNVQRYADTGKVRKAVSSWGINHGIGLVPDRRGEAR